MFFASSCGLSELLRLAVQNKVAFDLIAVRGTVSIVGTKFTRYQLSSSSFPLTEVLYNAGHAVLRREGSTFLFKKKDKRVARVDSLFVTQSSGVVKHYAGPSHPGYIAGSICEVQTSNRLLRS